MSANIEKVITLSPAEARAGVTLRLNNQVKKKCPVCRGRGRKRDLSNITATAPFECPDCDATGVILASEELETEIKPVEDLDQLTSFGSEKSLVYEGLGNYSKPDQARGDLILKIRIDHVVVEEESRDFSVLSYGNFENFKEVFEEEQDKFRRSTDNSQNSQSKSTQQQFWLEEFDEDGFEELQDEEELEFEEDVIEENSGEIYQPLIQMASPDLYKKNAFRLLGVLPGISEREIKRTIDKITKLHRVGGINTNSLGILALPDLNEETIDFAGQAIQDAENRFLHELFWYYPAVITGEEENETVMDALRAGDLDQAINILENDISDEDTGDYDEEKDLFGRKMHNLAILAHIRSIETDQDWGYVQYCWEKLYTGDKFWDFLSKQRVDQINNPLVRASTINRIRKTFPRFLQTLNAKLALFFAGRGNYAAAAKQVEQVYEYWLDDDLGKEILLEVVQPQKEQLQELCEIFEVEIETSKDQSSTKIRTFLDRAMNPIRILETLLGSENASALNWSDKAINHAWNAAVDFANKTENWREALSINSLLRYFPLSPEMKERLERDEQLLKSRLFESEIEPLCAKAAEACEKDIKQTPTIVKNFVIGGKSLIKTLNPENTEDVNWGDIIVRLARNLVIEFGNETKQWEECLSLQHTLLELAESEDLKKQIVRESQILVKRLHEKEIADLLDKAIEASKESFPPVPITVRDVLTKSGSIIEEKAKKFGAQNVIVRDLKEVVFNVAFGLLIDYVNEKEDFGKTLEVLEKLKPFAVTKEQQKKLSDNVEILKTNGDFYYKNVLCWFCHENKGENVSNITVSMHGDVERDRFLNRTKVTWRGLETTVPRCISCDAIHGKRTWAKTKGIFFGLLTGLLFNLPLFFIYSESLKAEMIWLSLLLIGGFIGLGFDIANQLHRIKETKKVGEYSSRYKHPQIIELQKQGWSIGKKPST